MTPLLPTPQRILVIRTQNIVCTAHGRLLPALRTERL